MRYGRRGKGVFSPNTPFFYERARFAPYELTHVRASPGDCVRRAGRKRGASFESSEALAEQPAVARSGQCRGAASMLSQGVARCGARPSTY
eukprot:scaffold14717_cov69-Phaeocystis_antarctica.AAC.1